MQIDFGNTAQDYGQCRAGFPDALFERLATFGAGLSGQRVLDLGTGTGTLARGFALRGCAVTALDPSAPLLVHDGGNPPAAICSEGIARSPS